MKLKISIVLFLSILAILTKIIITQAQGTAIVLDSSGRAVSSATIFAIGSDDIYRFISDSQGYWTGSSLNSSNYEIYTASTDYETWPAPRKISSGDNLLLTFAPNSNAISDGDFEGNVWDSWQATNGTIDLSSRAFDGVQSATMGNSAGHEVSCYQNKQMGELWTLKQSITVPDISNPTLSFVHKISTSQSSFDYAWLEVVLMKDARPTYLIPWGELWQAQDWSLKTLNLSDWRGQTVDLLFQTVDCSSQSFTVSIDRVSLGPGTAPVSTPTPTPNPNATPTPTPDSTDWPIEINPSATYRAKVRQLTACENNGKHHLFIYVVDEQGNGIPDVDLRVSWPDGETTIHTGTKGEHPGLVDFPMYKGHYKVEIISDTSDIVGPLTPSIPHDELCVDNGNPVGNSLFHYSYEVVFTKTR